MSDIGLNFSGLDILGIGAILALPVTTIILVILVALRLRARGSGWRRSWRWVLNGGIATIAPIWGIGAGLLAWLSVDGLIEEMRAASRHFILAGERAIAGISLPAGSEVSLDGYDRLVSVRLPAGTTVTLEGVTWRNDIEFFPTDTAMPARIRSAVPAVDATFDGIPCRAAPGSRSGLPALDICDPARWREMPRHEPKLPMLPGGSAQCTSLALRIKPLSCSRERQRRLWSVAPSPNPRRWRISPVRKVRRSRSSTAA